MSDDLATPTDLIGATGSVPFDLSTATPTAVFGDNPDLWFRFTAPGSGVLNIVLPDPVDYTPTPSDPGLVLRSHEPYDPDPLEMLYTNRYEYSHIVDGEIDLEVRVSTRPIGIRLHDMRGSTSTVAGTLAWTFYADPPIGGGEPGTAAGAYAAILVRPFRPHFADGE